MPTNLFRGDKPDGLPKSITCGIRDDSIDLQPDLAESDHANGPHHDCGSAGNGVSFFRSVGAKKKRSLSGASAQQHQPLGGGVYSGYMSAGRLSTSRVASEPGSQSQRVAVYVDGLNLFYGLKARRWHRYYWLDLRQLAENLLLPGQ